MMDDMLIGMNVDGLQTRQIVPVPETELTYTGGRLMVGWMDGWRNCLHAIARTIRPFKYGLQHLA